MALENMNIPRGSMNHVAQHDEAYIATPLGMIHAKANQTGIYSLCFIDNQIITNTTNESPNSILQQLTHELTAYFAGTLTTFQVPYHLHGSSFQRQVWHQLTQIPFGHTHSYQTIAYALARPTASRAVGAANRFNPLALIIPCHRVIMHNGKLGGYYGKVARKQWLLEHEKKISKHLTSDDAQ